MKNQKLILAAMFTIATLTLNATVRTVSNHVLGGAQYADLWSAYQACSSGDTVVIEGTTTSYNLFNDFAKNLVVIGPGINTQKQGFNTAWLERANGGGYGATWFFSSGAQGSKFYGLDFAVGSLHELEINVSNLTFENCRFSRGVRVAGSNTQFINCVFDDGSVYMPNMVTSVVFTNCIFDIPVEGNSAYQQVIFDHCMFLTSSNCFTTINSWKFSNSVFMNTTNFSGAASCEFQNNICRLSATFPPAGNVDLGGNQVGVNPNFVTYTLGATYSTSHDYHLQAGSLAIGAATDATDIGVHGGFSNFSEQGEALIVPVVRSMSISNPTVLPNGTISVQVTATKPDDN